MAHEVIRTDRFEEEYERILAYLADNLSAPGAARRLIEAVDKCIATLAEFPDMHAVAPLSKFAKHPLRKCLTGKYVIVYTVSADAVVLLHVFHQSQDYERLLDER